MNLLNIIGKFNPNKKTIYNFSIIKIQFIWLLDLHVKQLLKVLSPFLLYVLQEEKQFLNLK